MQCPVCKVDLAITFRNEIEIDYCPQCRGVWLDRGELDKMIERSELAANVTTPPPASPPANNQWAERAPAPSPAPYPPAPAPNYGHSKPYRHHDDDDDDYKYRQGHKHHKRKGFLGELFDFD